MCIQSHFLESNRINDLEYKLPDLHRKLFSYLLVSRAVVSKFFLTRCLFNKALICVDIYLLFIYLSICILTFLLLLANILGHSKQLKAKLITNDSERKSVLQIPLTVTLVRLLAS